jgi:hypothetical protein
LEQKKMCYAKVFLLHTVELETVLRVWDSHSLKGE